MKSKLFKKAIACVCTAAMVAQFGFVIPASAVAPIYSQNFETQTVGKITDTKLATSDAAQDWLEIKSDEDHGKYLSFDRSATAIAGAPSGKGANSRGGYVNFTADVSGKDSYVIEFDASLTPGNNQNAEIAIKTSGFAYTGGNINYGAGSGYLFKMSTEYDSVVSTDGTWTINNTATAKAKVTPGSWYHYKLIIDQTKALTSVTITGADNQAVVDKLIVGVNGTKTDVKGIYMLAGRYNPVLNFDNIIVRDTTVDDEFGTLPAETINSLSFAEASTEGTVLPAKVTPNEKPEATDTYYIDLTATGTLGNDIFTTYPDNYTVDWKVIGLGNEDGYINILLDDNDTTNLTTSENDTVTGSKATGAQVTIRNGVSNWFAQIEATVNFTDENGAKKSLTTTKNFVVLAAAKNASQIFPDAGYPEAANKYADDLVGYKSPALLIDSRDTILDWTIYGGNAFRYIELAQEENGDKYLDFSTGTGTGSTVAELNIGNITDEFVIDMVTKFTGSTNWGYYDTTPNNKLTTTGFSFEYAGGAIKAGTESVSGLANDTWYRLVISCNRKVGKFSVTVIDENGTTLGTAEGATDDGTGTCKYFASNFGGAANSHRYIKSCKIYYPSIAAMTVNATADTLSVPTGEVTTEKKLDENGVFVYDTETKALTVNIADKTSAKLITAKFDKNNAFVGVSLSDLTFAEGKATVENYEPVEGAKVFAWDTYEAMTPATPVIGQYVEEDEEDPTAELSAMLTSTEGFDMSSAVTWEMDTDDENIILTPSGAQGAILTVAHGAPAGPVTITARCGSSAAEKVINLTTTGNSIAFEKSTASMTIPFSGEVAVEADYLAYTVDKKGNKTEFAVDDDGNATTTPSTITYNVLDKNSADITDNMPVGVTFDKETGKLKVTDQAKSGIIYIKATNNDTTPLSRVVKVNIHGLSFAFGNDAPADDSFTQVTKDIYSDKIGYGFADASAITANGSNVTGTADYRFKAKVPNGNYIVNVVTTSATMLSEVVEGVPATTGITKSGANFNVAVCDGILDLTFLNGSSLSSISITQAPTKSALTKPAVYAIGDSTTSNTGNGAKSWGNCVGGGVTLPDTFSSFSNNGMAGRDSVNYYNQGRVETVLLNICPGDYVTVNMGINSKETGEAASYYTLLDNYYVQGIIQRGGIPVILTATPQGPVGNYVGNYNASAEVGKQFTCNRGTGAHNGDLRKIAQKYDLNIIEMGYWGDDYFNGLRDTDVTAYNEANGTEFTTVIDMVKSWYPDHNHYYEYLGNKIGQYILDSVAEIANTAEGETSSFHWSKDPHIN